MTSPRKKKNKMERADIPLVSTRKLVAGDQGRKFGLSPRLVRGKRRDVFLFFSDTTAGMPAFLRSFRGLGIPSPDIRRAKFLFRAATKALQQVAIVCYARSEDTSGCVVVPDRVVHADGSVESVLRVWIYEMQLTGEVSQTVSVQIGWISQHVIDRMFKRLQTTCLATVVDELTAGMKWMHGLVAMCAAHVNEIQQLPIPSELGILLCVRDQASQMLNVRTFLPKGHSPRLDASVASLEEWRDSITKDGMAESFVRLSELAENKWWKERHESQQADAGHGNGM